MRKFALLIAVGMLATMVTTPFAHASDTEQMTCLAQGGTLSANNGGWRIDNGRVPLVEVQPILPCGLASDQAPAPGAVPDPLEAVFGSILYLNNSTPQPFACGNGSLTGWGRIYKGGLSPEGYEVSWSATLTDGVGDFSGTGTPVFHAGGPRSFSGKIVIDDGSKIGQCDDTYPNAKVLLQLTIS